MRHLAGLLTIGILCVGGLCPDFAILNQHHVVDYETMSICDDVGSMDDDCCLFRHRTPVESIIVNNLETPSFKSIIIYSDDSSLVLHDGQQVEFAENNLIDGIKLTGSVIKLE